MIEKQHEENLKLIKQYGLKVGLILRVKKDFIHSHSNYKGGDLIKIIHVHKKYGWVLFDKFPGMKQTPKDIMDLCEVATKENIIESLK